MQKAPVLAATILFLSGCASVIEGDTQVIGVSTNPTGASCTMTRNGAIIARINPTPGMVRIEKTKHNITVECERDGFQPAAVTARSDEAAATFGNVLIGGLIGWIADSATGSDNKYDSAVNITLAPLSSAEVTTRR
ncbi:MAG: hypothetical protein F8N37_20995 [Telmatospirillum sp.]|nr:hypothetical protein [Telmatospirillum sp.]